MNLIEQRGTGVSIVRACHAVGLSRATLYRRRRPRPIVPSGGSGGKRKPPRKLSAEERTKLIKTLHAPEFADQPPAEIFGALLSRGIYLASIRTMYRVLSELGENKDRRRQRIPHSYVPPRLTATAPNQVWTWDITKLPSTVKGVFFYLYLVMDLFSRYVVGWMASAKENAAYATRLIGDTVARWGIEPGTLQLHSDRGSPMKSGSMAQMTAMLGVELSLSRPRVSDDNPFVESQFKTLKSQPRRPRLRSSREGRRLGIHAEDRQLAPRPEAKGFLTLSPEVLRNPAFHPGPATSREAWLSIIPSRPPSPPTTRACGNEDDSVSSFAIRGLAYRTGGWLTLTSASWGELLEHEADYEAKPRDCKVRACWRVLGKRLPLVALTEHTAPERYCRTGTPRSRR